MKKLHITLNGTSPLIEHSPKCVNPLHPIAKEMKLYTSKRKKTEEDLYQVTYAAHETTSRICSESTAY